MSTITINLKEKNSFKKLLSWGAVFIGSAILALSIVLFITPYQIIPGGVFGIGIILNHFYPDIMVGTFGICMEVPLMILAFLALGKGIGAKTIFSASVTPLIMNLFTTYIGSTPETIFGGTMNLSNDILLASIFGGVGMGVGVGLIFANQGTSGGTDIVSMVISKYFRLPLSKSIIIVETFIVIAGIIVFEDWKLPLYSIITIFALTRIIDYMIEGVSTDKLLFIISKEHDKIKKYIINDLNRGGTCIKAEGMYTKEGKNIIFVVIERKQLPLVRAQIKMVDPKAFMVVVEAHETLGDGFKPFLESSEK